MPGTVRTCALFALVGLALAACGRSDSYEPRASAAAKADAGVAVRPDGGGPCKGEADAVLCAKAGKNCGAVAATDACGVARVVPCGECRAPQTCGGAGEANVCGDSSCADRAWRLETLRSVAAEAGPVIAVDAAGAPHVSYFVNQPLGSWVYAKKTATGWTSTDLANAWSPPSSIAIFPPDVAAMASTNNYMSVYILEAIPRMEILFPQEVGSSPEPLARVSGTGTMHLVFGGKKTTAGGVEPRLRYAKRSVGVEDGVWGPSEEVVDAKAIHKDLAINPGGDVHVAYHDVDSRTLMHARRVAQTFVPSAVDSEVNDWEPPSIAADGSGTVHLAYTRTNGSPVTVRRDAEVRYARRAAGAQAWDRQSVSSKGTAYPSIAIDGTGAVHIVYATLTGIAHLQRLPAGNWIADTVGEVGSVQDPAQFPASGPRIAAGPRGVDLHVVYEDWIKKTVVYAHRCE